MPTIASISILGIILGASQFHKGRSFLAKKNREIFGAIVCVVAAALTLLSYQQYQAWKYDGLAQFFLPPERSWGYFLFYVGSRFFAPYVISLVVALIFIVVAYWANRKYHERFFEREEIYLAAYSLFLVGYPGILVYIPLVLVAYLSLQLTLALLHEGMSRMPMYHLWVPLAICVIIGMKWIVSVPVWSLMKI